MTDTYRWAVDTPGAKDFAASREYVQGVDMDSALDEDDVAPSVDPGTWEYFVHTVTLVHDRSPGTPILWEVNAYGGFKWYMGVEEAEGLAQILLAAAARARAAQSIKEQA